MPSLAAQKAWLVLLSWDGKGLSDKERGWLQRGIAENLHARLAAKVSAEKRSPDYTPGWNLLLAELTAQTGEPNWTAALRAAYGEQPHLFTVDAALEGEDLDRKLLWWRDRARRSLRTKRSDVAWLGLVARLLGKPVPAPPRGN